MIIKRLYEIIFKNNRKKDILVEKEHLNLSVYIKYLFVRLKIKKTYQKSSSSGDCHRELSREIKLKPILPVNEPILPVNEPFLELFPNFWKDDWELGMPPFSSEIFVISNHFLKFTHFLKSLSNS